MLVARRPGGARGASREPHPVGARAESARERPTSDALAAPPAGERCPPALPRCPVVVSSPKYSPTLLGLFLGHRRCNNSALLAAHHAATSSREVAAGHGFVAGNPVGDIHRAGVRHGAETGHGLAVGTAVGGLRRRLRCGRCPSSRRRPLRCRRRWVRRRQLGRRHPQGRRKPWNRHRQCGRHCLYSRPRPRAAGHRVATANGSAAGHGAAADPGCVTGNPFDDIHRAGVCHGAAAGLVMAIGSVVDGVRSAQAAVWPLSIESPHAIALPQAIAPLQVIRSLQASCPLTPLGGRRPQCRCRPWCRGRPWHRGRRPQTIEECRKPWRISSPDRRRSWSRRP